MNQLPEQAIRIKEQAQGLFMQFGLKSVSMDDIANSLGISKKTIYHFYQDKDELVKAVVQSIIQENQATCNADRSRASDAIHEIFLSMDMMLEMFHSMNPSLLFDMHKYYPAAYQIFLQHKNDYLYGLIKENIERGIQEDLYRSDFHIEAIARFRVESIIIPFNPEYHSKVKASIAQIQNEIALHFLYGVVTPKGYKLIVKYKEQRTQ